MKHYFVYCFLLYILSLQLGIAQTTNQSPLNLPVIIPPSPQAQAFMRYGEIPVDYSTGVPRIEIPIYTIKTSKFQLPISISYHASGIKVNDIATEVGLGWVLNCGGIISRSVLGKRDERMIHVPTFINKDQFIAWKKTTSATEYIEHMNSFYPMEDNMADRFSYSLPNGISGTFRFEYPFINNKIIMLPYRPIKIEKTLSEPQSSLFDISEFKITDDNGTIYYFESIPGHETEALTDWFLTKMISSDKTDTIIFNYGYSSQPVTMQVLDYSYSYQGPTSVLAKSLFCDQFPLPNENGVLSLPSGSVKYETPLLTSIESSNLKINFYYKKDRLDFSFLNRLDYISITNKIKELKKVNFITSYFGQQELKNLRLRLDNLIFSNQNDAKEERYSFNYNDALPSYTTSSSPYCEDYWGYFNNSFGATNLPLDFIPEEYRLAAQPGDRNPNPYVSQACMIKSIKYPTGGKTEFEFERNYAKGVYPEKTNPDGYIGGHRIKTIKNFDEYNKQIGVRNYEYFGAQVRPVIGDFFKYNQTYFLFSSSGGVSSPYINCYEYYSRYIYLSNPILPLEIATGLPIMYTTVVEYNGAKADNVGKTIYKYNPPVSPNDMNLHPDLGPRNIHPFQYDRGSYTPELISKFEYAYNNQKYMPVKKTFYDYSTLFSNESHTGFQLVQNIEYNGYPELYDDEPSLNDPDLVTILDTKAYQEARLLNKTETYTYDQKDSTIYNKTLNELFYDNFNLQVRKNITYGSDGKELRSEFEYPIDKNLPGTIYQNMVDKNIISTPLSSTKYKDNVFLESVSTEYGIFNSNPNQIYPSVVNTKKGNALTEARLKYNSYDEKGNIINVSKDNDIKYTYLWGYNKTLPVAKVENTDYKEEFNNTSSSIYGSISSFGEYQFNDGFKVDNDEEVLFKRIYDKNEVRCVCTITFYNTNGSSTGITITDRLVSDSHYQLSSSVLLPAGIYTAKIKIEPLDIQNYGQSLNLEITLEKAGKYNYPFYTSFEEDVAKISSDYFKTGKKSHIGVYNIRLPKILVTDKPYILTYWIKPTALSNWEYREQVFTTSANDYITIGTAESYIDEVRLLPNDALMTTNTYDPLVGTTSTTDPNNITTYFEYDAFGRLKLVRDKDGKILKQNLYHYIGQ